MKTRVHLRHWRILAIGLGLAVGTAQGQIATDGTVGSAQSLTGPNYAIGAGLGTQRGANLFHSFSTFNINTGESATFTGPNGLQNVISRVTGGGLSNIDGTLRSEINGANFWFINPAGVVFGANAKLDVPAAFHVSTADELRFADGAVFSAANPAISTLSAEPVAAFGFLSAAPKRIEVNGGYLGVKEGQTLSLVGGDINLSNATIYAPAGRLNIASVGSAGEVVPTETDLELRGFGALGTLTMWRDPEVERISVDKGEPFGEVPLGDLDTSGTGSGAMFIRGENWLHHGGWVFADTYGGQAGQDIDVAVTGDLTLLNGGVIGTRTFSKSNAGSVTVAARNLLVDRMGSEFVTGLISSADPDSTGAGGNVNLTIADNLTVQNGGQIRASTFSEGNAGVITVTARNLLVDGMGSASVTGLASSAEPDSTGAGGNVNLTIADSLTVQNGGVIRANTFSAGSAGAVTVTARNLLVDGMGSAFFTGLSSSADRDSTGAGGNINLTIADNLTVQNGGKIRASTFGAGNAGVVTVTTRNLLVDRMGSAFVTGLISSAEPDSTGAGGNVNLTIADGLTVQNGGVIRASTFGAGKAGVVTVTARNLLVDGMGSTLFTGLSSSAERGSTEAGGDVNLTIADTLTVQNGGVIGASTFSTGNAGAITITARNLLVDRMGSALVTGLASGAEPGSTGIGGNVTLDIADSLTVQNGGVIRASTWGAGKAGVVTVTARNLLVDGLGYSGLTGLTSNANPGSTGTGGNVTLDIADALNVQNGGQISTSTFGAGNAGSVTVSAGKSMILAGVGVKDGHFFPSGLFVSAVSTGQASDLTVTTPTLTISDGAGIFATSTRTTGGNLLIDAADLRLFNGSQISTSVFGDPTTTGGDVEINSRTVVALDGSKVTAKAKQGKGGNILVNADVFLHDAPSIDDVLNASSESTVTGNQGSVTINTAIDPARSVVGVTRRLGDLNDANQDPCARRKGQKKSTLTKVGRGGLPADNRPEGMTVSLSGGDWTPPAEPVEPAPSVQEPLELSADRDDCRL